jgi:hypothetical protein
MKNIRYLDKLIDELAKGKKMEKILRDSSWSSQASPVNNLHWAFLYL